MESAPNNDIVDVTFSQRSIGLNVVWQDKLKGVIIQGFRQEDGEAREESFICGSCKVAISHVPHFCPCLVVSASNIMCRPVDIDPLV